MKRSDITIGDDRRGRFKPCDGPRGDGASRPANPAPARPTAPMPQYTARCRTRC